MKKLLKKLYYYLNKPSTPTKYRYTYTVNWEDRSFKLKQEEKK